MLQRHTICLKPANRSGFTLIELLVAVAVIGIVAIIAMPTMTDLVNNSRVTSQTEELAASLQLARAEAIRRNARVTVCAGTEGVCSGSTTWSNWTIFGADTTAATATTDIIRDTTVNGSMQVSGPTAGIVFKPSGLIDGPRTLEASMYTHRRCLTVLSSGIVSVTKGACP